MIRPQGQTHALLAAMAGLSAMSLIFATQLTAIATAVLAVVAIITAWYARRAFLKQSQKDPRH